MLPEEYDELVRQTAVFPGVGATDGLAYCALGLNGEAGEVAEKVKKMIRDDAGVLTAERRAAILLELGDTLWYVTAAAACLGADLRQIMIANAVKLRNRQDRGVLHGSGDAR